MVKLAMVLLTLLLCVSFVTATQVFHIKPENTNSTCPDPCLTLNEFALSNTSSYESVSLVFLPGKHSLTSLLSMSNKIDSSFKTLTGNVTIQCNGMVIFAFVNVTNLQIEDISFVACFIPKNFGLVFLNSTEVTINDISFSEVQYGGVLLLLNSHVHLNDITFSHNRGILLSADKNALVNLTGQCLFENNFGIGFDGTNSSFIFDGNVSFVQNTGDPNPGFAGMTLENCEVYNFGDLNFLYNSGQQILYLDTCHFESSGSLSFIGNKVHADGILVQEVTISIRFSVMSVRSFVYSMNQGFALLSYSPFSVMERLEISGNTLSNDFYHSVFDIQHSTTQLTGIVTISNNEAKGMSSAGMQFVNQSVSVNGCISVVNNRADLSSGILVGESTLTLFGILNVTNNSALGEVAGLSVESSSLYVSGFFDFLDNRGQSGATCLAFLNSVCVFNGSTSITGSVSNLHPHFIDNSNVTFAGTTYVSNNLVQNKYGGGLQISESILKLEGSYVFENNQAPTDGGGAIYAFNSELIFAGDGNFTNNLGKSGGALYLIYHSKLILLPHSLTAFTKNKAIVGGAIHIDDLLSFVNCTNDKRYNSVSPACFFDIVSDNVLVFDENEATDGGTALYGGMLNRCVLSGTGQNALEVFKSASIFKNFSSLTLSSDPFHLCFCQDGYPNCHFNKINVVARRGEQFSVSVVVQNELNVDIVALVRSYLVSSFNNTDKKIGTDGILQKVNNTCTELNFRVSSPGDTEQLTMYAEGPCRDVGNTSKSINVQFIDCPIGFVLDVGICVCDPHLRSYTTSCNIDTGGIEKPTNFWVGLSYNNSGNFTGLQLFPNCPFDYCLFPSAPVIMTSPDTQCNYNRSGILCGSCESNLSLLLGSSTCSECSNYYLFLLIPFALMGILLVTCLFLLKVTVETGAIHGLIFYANIVAVNKATMVPSGTFKGLSTFLAWLNLDFGIETCFFNGMNQYAKTWLQFVFPVYLLVLVLLIIIVCKNSISASENLRKLGDPVCVLATVIMLSYTKIVRTILATLSFASIEFSDGLQSAVVWLFDGNVHYAQGNHVILLVFALAVLIFFVFPYTTMLTVAQFVTESCWISKTSLYRRWYEFFKRHHLPYKSNHRYWPGLFLIVRIILLVTFAVNFLENPSTNLLAISTVCICTGSYTWIVGGVYELKLLKNALGEKRYVDFIDMWLLDALESMFLLNLGIFTAATYHIRATTNSVEDQAILANISLAFTFVLFLLIVGIHIYLRFVEYTRYRKNRANINNHEPENEEARHLLNVSANYGAADPIKPTVQVVPPPRRKFADFSQLREPMLDDK